VLARGERPVFKARSPVLGPRLSNLIDDASSVVPDSGVCSLFLEDWHLLLGPLSYISQWRLLPSSITEVVLIWIMIEAGDVLGLRSVAARLPLVKTVHDVPPEVLDSLGTGAGVLHFLVVGLNQGFDVL